MALSPTSSKGISSNAVSSVFTRTGAVVAADGDYSGVVAAHLTGAVAATRYVGGVATVAPTTGTFAVGDFVIAQNGGLFVCTVAGTPGTWVAVGGSSSPVAQPFNYYGSVTGASSAIVVASGGGGSLANWVQAGPTFYPGQAASFFDLTDPTNPVVLANGNYSFDMEIQSLTGAALGFISGVLYLDTAGMDDGPGVAIPLTPTYTIAPLSCHRYLAAGTVIQLFLYQTSGGNLSVNTWMQVSKEATS